MPRSQKAYSKTIDQVTRTTFSVLPLLRKKLLRMDLIQAEHGMPMSHIQVLTMLGAEPIMSVSAISRRLGIAKPNITPLVDRLVELDYVERRRSELDRRVVNVILLSKGRGKLDEIYQSVVGHVSGSIGEDISEQEVAELEKALNTIEAILADRPGISLQA